MLGVIFCRVMVNRQTAIAHQRILEEVEDIVFQDTKKRLRWRHLHAETLHERNGLILQWVGDQHGGQAKGEYYIP